MKVIALVGDQVSPAFSLSGLEVVSPKDHQELLRVFDDIIHQKDIAMLIISARYAMALKKEIEEVRISHNPIVILEISSSRGNYNVGEKLMREIKKTIG